MVTKPCLGLPPGLPPPLGPPAALCAPGAEPAARVALPARAPGYRSSRAPGVGWALCSDPEVEAYEVILESRLLEQRLSAR